MKGGEQHNPQIAKLAAPHDTNAKTNWGFL
jgi:hypothetical protein